MNTRNTLKTGLLLAALTTLFVVVGAAIGGVSGMVIALLFALLMNAAAYWFSARLALTMAGARPVSRDDAPQLHQLVEDLAARAHVPVPAVYVIDNPSPNAFATGRDPAHAAVAVTSGIMELLDAQELRGVLAHEFAHIIHRDILLSSVAAAVAGAITALANIFQFATLFGHHQEDDDGPGLAGSLALVVLAPIAATLLQLAVSRTREYAADSAGAKLAGDPLDLARALRKLEQGTWVRPMDANPVTASLYIVHPLAGGGLRQLFQTHPPTARRIARLETMTQERAPGATATA